VVACIIDKMEWDWCCLLHTVGSYKGRLQIEFDSWCLHYETIPFFKARVI